MKRVVSAGVLAMLIVGFAVYLPAHAQNPVAVSSSTLQSLTTETTLHATASHVVQPYGVYHELASGALYAANAVDNVSITMTSGFPSFSSYEANTTLAEWASGCQTDTAEQSGANLVLDYSGASCGIAPILKLTFSPLPTYNATANNCTLFWTHESYSWCGDSGFSYSAGVLTIVPPSATFTIDPTLYQSNNCVHNNSGVNTQTCAFSSNVIQKDLLTVYVFTNAATITSVKDSVGSGNTYSCDECNKAVSGGFFLSLFYVSTAAGGANTVTITYPSAVTIQQVSIAEWSSLGTPDNGYSTSSGSSSSGSVVSFTPSAASIVIAVAGANTGGSTTCTAGSGFTLGINANFGAVNMCDQYSTSNISTATTAPITFSTSIGWTEIAEAFPMIYGQTTLLTETVNAPPGGALVQAGTTISTSTVLTITSTTTWTVTAVPFASYIFDGWSGFACTDLVNPVQTCSITTISSYTTSSTVSSTLTASMSMNSSGASGKTILAAFVIVGIILMLCGMAWAVSKR